MATVRGSVVATGAAVLLVAALTGCGSQGKEITVVPGAEAGSSSSAASSDSEQAAAEAAETVEHLASSAYSARYAGMKMVDGALVVYRTAGPEKMDTALLAAASPISVTFEDASYSAADLAPLRTKVEKDVTYWSERGITVTSVAVAYDGSGVQVGVNNVAAAREQFTDRYGDSSALLLSEEAPNVIMK